MGWTPPSFPTVPLMEGSHCRGLLWAWPAAQGLPLQDSEAPHTGVGSGDSGRQERGHLPHGNSFELHLWGLSPSSHQNPPGALMPPNQAGRVCVGVAGSAQGVRFPGEPSPEPSAEPQRSCNPTLSVLPCEGLSPSSEAWRGLAFRPWAGQGVQKEAAANGVWRAGLANLTSSCLEARLPLPLGLCT